MSNTRIVIILIIATEFMVAWYAAQAAWRRPSLKTNKRTVMGMIVGIGMFLYGTGRLFAVITNMKFGQHLSKCITGDLEERSVVQAVLQAVAIWIFAWAFTADDRPWWLRRKVNALFEKLQ